MTTVDKALNLLGFFSLSRPEWGLSDLARNAALDKATALRLLRSMQRHELIEQDPETRRFRLGKAFLTLARVREQSFPLASIVSKWLGQLALETGETAHASLATERAMTTIGISEPKRSARVHVDPSQPLPFHATDSGLACLAFGPERRREAVLSGGGLHRHAAMTETDPGRVRARLEQVRQSGYATGEQTFEDEVTGIAVPFFDGSGLAQGAIAVATPTMRLTPALQQKIRTCLMRTSLELAVSLGSTLPAGFAAIAEEYR
ncbi:MAG: IclR family transcriptional regulator [Zhengella sp.]|uniref:IclR family transcriptional regulator n=1 Tax=Zhengella sp. TaxID=2282762 RepID=UPI001DE80BC7|nr:IclR family transcriptional regulator [Notoacmeibacter sp.]MCC0025777.1 IclR family transcriptional regulator [Brucellaceae bacterium]